MLSRVSEEFLSSECLFEFLERMEELTGIHIGILDMDLVDPSQTEPRETHAYGGAMKPCAELLINNVKQGYLSVPQETELTEELLPVLKLIAAFVAKMPELTIHISTDSDAYVAGMYELLFSTDFERMSSLRVQLGLSRFADKSKPLNCFLINITPYKAAGISSGLETKLRSEFMCKGDVLLNHNEAWVLFHVQPEKQLAGEFEAALEKMLKSYRALACVSEPIYNPTHDYRLRQHYNQNEQVLLFLKKSGYEGKRLVKYDDYRLVSMVYFALQSTNPLIFGKYRYVNNTVMNICQYDKEKGTEYFQTLFIYLNSRFSLNETAWALNIHRNTVVYRIKQLRERFGINFDSSEECFQLNLSCRIYTISNYFEYEEGT